MYGEGNSAKLVGDVMQSANQVMAGLAENGIDIQAMLTGALAGKLASN
jgi:flotillin